STELITELRHAIHLPEQVHLKEVVNGSGHGCFGSCPLLGLSGQHHLPGTHRRGGHERGHNDAASQKGAAISPRKLPHPVSPRWRTRLNRLVGEVALDIRRESAGRFVTSIAVLLQSFHDQPVQLTPQPWSKLPR